MERQPFVQEGVVGAEEVERAAILTDDALDEELRLGAERLTQAVVEVREVALRRSGQRHVPQEQPLPREVLHQRVGAWVGHHPPHLLLEHAGVPQLPFHRDVQQLVVRDAAPQEERQPRRQFEVADTVGGAASGVGRIDLDPVQELGADQQALERTLDAALEPALRPPFFEERKERRHVLVGHRAAVGAACQRREDRPRARDLTRGCRVPRPRRRRGCCRRPAGEDTTSARRIPGHAGRVRPADLHASQRRAHARLGHVVARRVRAQERQAHGLVHRRRLLQKRHRDLALASFHRDAHVPVLVGAVALLPRHGRRGRSPAPRLRAALWRRTFRLRIRCVLGGIGTGGTSHEPASERPAAARPPERRARRHLHGPAAAGPARRRRHHAVRGRPPEARPAA